MFLGLCRQKPLSAQRRNSIREDWISSRKDKNRIEWGLPLNSPYRASLSRAASWWLRSNRFRISYISWERHLSSTSELVFHLQVAKANSSVPGPTHLWLQLRLKPMLSVQFNSLVLRLIAQPASHLKKLWNGSFTYFACLDIGPSSNWPLAKWIEWGALC